MHFPKPNKRIASNLRENAFFLTSALFAWCLLMPHPLFSTLRMLVMGFSSLSALQILSIAVMLAGTAAVLAACAFYRPAVTLCAHLRKPDLPIVLTTGIIFLSLIPNFAGYILMLNGPSYAMSLLIALACGICALPAIYMIVCRFIDCRVRRIPMWSAEARAWNTRSFLQFFAAALGIFLLFFIAYYPGASSVDTADQLEQVVSGRYSDWHPVIHTLLVLTLPYKLTGTFSGIIVFQMIAFAFSLSYMAQIIERYGSRRAAWTALLAVLLTPSTGAIAVYPWKDTSFAITAILLMGFAVQILFTHGEWLRHSLRLTAFALVFALATLFRHNAILFTFPLLIAVLLSLPVKQCIRLCALALCIVLLILGPLYTLLDVEKPDQRHTETMGLPLTIIGNVVREAPERLNDEVKEYVYSIASQEEWEQHYVCGSFNSIKWNGADTSVVDESSYLKTLKITWECIKAAPGSSFRALFKLTGMVWGIGVDVDWGVKPRYAETVCGTDYGGIALLGYLLFGLNGLSTVIKYPLCFTGFMNLLVVLYILCRGNLRSRNYRKRCLLCLSILVYNLGTMLLLTGNDFRFFYYTLPVLPLALLSLSRHDSKES